MIVDGGAVPIIHLLVGAWLSLVERSVRDREVGGSNPLAPTSSSQISNSLTEFGGRSRLGVGFFFTQVSDVAPDPPANR